MRGLLKTILLQKYKLTTLFTINQKLMYNDQRRVFLAMYIAMYSTVAGIVSDVLQYDFLKIKRTIRKYLIITRNL